MKKPSKKSNKSPLFIYDRDGLIEHISPLPYLLLLPPPCSKALHPKMIPHILYICVGAKVNKTGLSEM